MSPPDLWRWHSVHDRPTKDANYIAPSLKKSSMRSLYYDQRMVVRRPSTTVRKASNPEYPSANAVVDYRRSPTTRAGDGLYESKLELLVEHI